MQGRSTRLLLQCVSGLFLALMMMTVRDDVSGQEIPSVLKPSETTSAESLKKENTSGSVKSSVETALPPASVKYLLDKNGDPVPVPYSATLDDFLKFLATRNKPVTGPQAASITKIEIDGTADDERANLKVVFTIRLQEPDQFVSVPLYMNEGVLKQWSYTGDGEEVPFEKKDPEQGYVWWFKGRGPHTLELSVSVPLRKQLPSRRMVLSLPASPFSRAQLTLPYASVATKAFREQTFVDVKSVGEFRTTIEATDLGSRFDLTWNQAIAVQPNEVSLESQTNIRAQIESESVLLRADQLVNSLQGQFDKLTVRLPLGAELIKLDDLEKLTYKIDPKTPQIVVVTLKEKTNSAQLTWTVRLPVKFRTLTLDGFLLEGARKQVGRIGLSIADGLRFLAEPNDPSVLRINAGEFPANMGPVNRAYQFLSQPFKLTTKFDDVKPYFQVKPQLTLKASAQQLELDGIFEYRVDRDSLNEVVLTWPDHKTEGWIIDGVDEPGVVESYSTDDKGQITVRLIQNQKDRFNLRFRARRSIKANEDVDFTLPRPKSASRLSATTVVVANADNVETELTPRGETFMRPIPASNLELPDSVHSRKLTAYRVDTDEQSFSLRVAPQPQRIRTESLVEAQWQDNQFQIVQHLVYDVSYERLSQIRVSIPAALDADHVRYFTSRDIELTTELLTTPPGSPRQVQMKLGEGQLGRFEIQARYLVPFAKDSAFETDAEVSLPIINSLDEPFSETRVSLVQPEWFDAEPASSSTWKPQFSRQESRVWLSTGSPVSIPLKLVRSTHATGRGSVSHALIAVQIDGTGQGIVRAQFRVTSRSTTIPVVLPPTASPAKFFWDNQPVLSRDLVESPAESRKYEIQVADEPEKGSSPEHLLTVEYQDRISSPLGWTERLELRPPELPKCLWYAQVIWQTGLPSGQHLFTYPTSATPMFHWQRTGFIWSRKSDLGTEYVQQWVTPRGVKRPPESDLLVSEATTNNYMFSQFGSPQALTFQTLSSPMVLFFGAGFSLAVGFVMLRLVVLRHVMTLLLTSLIVAIIGLWYSAPLELLIQPMVAGLVFPATAVLLERWVRNRNDNGVLSFEGQGDFPPMQAFGSHYGGRLADPNGVTVHRPGSRDSRSNVPIESGSGVS